MNQDKHYNFWMVLRDRPVTIFLIVFILCTSTCTICGGKFEMRPVDSSPVQPVTP